MLHTPNTYLSFESASLIDSSCYLAAAVEALDVEEEADATDTFITRWNVTMMLLLLQQIVGAVGT